MITGANRGLGLEIARAYVRAGAAVFMCARNADALAAAGALLQDEFPAAQIHVLAGDVACEEDVERVVHAALSRLPDLSILVNNAGVYGPLGPLEGIDWRAWTDAININLLGSVLMIRALLPAFRARGKGKIIQLSGGGATNPLPRISAYAASKAAVVRLIETVARECDGSGIDANSIAPGALNTGMLDEVLEAGPDAVGAEFYNRAMSQKAKGGAGLESGAALAVFLASAESDGISGRLISAVWDNYADWVEHKEELARSDLYTLRRITGRDRGVTWGDR